MIGDPHAAEHGGTPEEPAATAAHARLTSTVTPRKRRQIFARDGYRCVVPGCRATQNLDIHHLRPQALGGSQDASNLCTLCGVHHFATHHGIVTIAGAAPDLTFTFHNETNDTCDRDLGDPCTCESSASSPRGREGPSVTGP